MGTDLTLDYHPITPTEAFEYPFDLTMDPPESYINASMTQLFYTFNTYHDLLYTLGFTEAAGNFEFNNNGKGGVGGDEVIIYAQDAAGTNNARFGTPPDGQSGYMEVYIFTLTTPFRDGGFDTSVILHEATHGGEFYPLAPPSRVKQGRLVLTSSSL
jgi:extracellular elastinolytic metalloproteinase